MQHQIQKRTCVCTSAHAHATGLLDTAPQGRITAAKAGLPGASLLSALPAAAPQGPRDPHGPASRAAQVLCATCCAQPLSSGQQHPLPA